MAITKQPQQRQTCRMWPQKSKQTDVKHRTMNTLSPGPAPHGSKHVSGVKEDWKGQQC
jgi:hypothetical protein